LPGDAIIRLQCVIILVVAVVFSALLGTRFFSVANFQSIGSQLPILGMLALGMGMTMLTGGINLSIIAGANACSLVMAAVIVSHPDSPLFLALALLAGAAVAVAIGTLNGALIAWVGVSPILATLGTMTLISGLNILLSNGTVISGFPTAIQYLGKDRKSTRLNSSHVKNSYAVFCLKKKHPEHHQRRTERENGPV